MKSLCVRGALICATVLLATAMSTPPTSAQMIPDPDCGPFRVNDEFGENGMEVAAAMLDPGGSYVVVWISVGNIYMRRYYSSGTPIPPDSPEPLWVSGKVISDMTVASDLQGNFVIVWSEYFAFTDVATIRAAVWSASAEEFDLTWVASLDLSLNAPQDPEIPEDDVGRVEYPSPSVAMGTDSRFVVVWDQLIGEGEDERFAVVGQRFDEDGDTEGDVFEVSTQGQNMDEEAFVHQTPSVGCDPSGNFVAAWECYRCEDLGEDENGWGIRARRFDNLGEPIGSESAVNTFAEKEQIYPAVAVGADGEYVVAWLDEDVDLNPNADGPAGILATVFNENGAPVTPFIDVTGGLVDEFSQYRTPSVTKGDVDGHFAITWAVGTDGYLRWFDKTGVPWDDPEATGTDQWGHAVAGDRQGNFAWVYISSPGGAVWARHYLQPVLLSVNDVSVYEDFPNNGESTAMLTVQASKEHPTATVSFDYETEDGTATEYEGDYVGESGTRDFDGDPSPLTETIEIQINSDDEYEPDERFYLNLISATNAAVARSPGVVTILNDDEASTITFADVEDLEDEGNEPLNHPFLFRVTLDEPQTEPVSVDYTTVQLEPEDIDPNDPYDPATEGVDYVPISGTLTIPGGSVEGYIGVEVLRDTVTERHEVFGVYLSNEVNVLIDEPPTDPSVHSNTDRIAHGVIQDNDCYSIEPTSAHFDHLGCESEPENPDERCIVTLTIENEPWCFDEWAMYTGDEWIGGFDPTGGGPEPGEPPPPVAIHYTVQPNGSLEPRDPPGEIGIVDPDSPDPEDPVTHVVMLVTQDGMGCQISISPEEQHFPMWGGAGEVEIVLDDDSALDCPWAVNMEDVPEWIIMTSDTSGGFLDGRVVVMEYEVEVNTGVGREGAIVINAGLTHHVTQNGVFFDDFDDDVLALDWLYYPVDSWEEFDHSLRTYVGGPGGQARAFASFAFPGCGQGTIITRMRVNRYSTGVAMLYGWYANEDNFVALTMDEFANRWTLTQWVDGVEAQMGSSTALPIHTHVIYDVALSFDGDVFVVTVDGAQVIFMPPVEGSEPDGTVGFGVFETHADFDMISVWADSATSFVYWDGFDSGDVSRWSGTVP